MKKIRKTLFTLLATAIAAGTVLPLAGCSGNGGTRGTHGRKQDYCGNRKRRIACVLAVRLKPALKMLQRNTDIRSLSAGLPAKAQKICRHQAGNGSNRTFK